jgi:signal transduction histidine kinase
MRRSIRQQVLIPILTIQSVALAAITMASVALAANRTERQIVDRINGVVDVLDRSSFPLTGAILARMKGLSGAEFVAYDAQGQAIAASGAELATSGLPLGVLPVWNTERFHALGDSPTLSLDGRRYFAALIRPRSSAAGQALLVLYPESSWRDARWDSAKAPLILGAGALAMMAAATTWIAHRISDRIHRLEHQVARIAEGDFREVDLGTYPPRDEIQDLAWSINRMCAQLRQMSQTIRQSERTQVLAQVAAGMAHQLRNALTGARMSIQIHLKRCDSARADSSMMVALRQLSLIEEQVRGLLTLGRLEERPHAPCDLVRLLHDVASLVRPTCEHGEVSLEIGPCEPSVTILADEPSLRAAVLNLALNAIEAAGSGGTVVLELRSSESERIIQVRDTGSGPARAMQATLFDSFVSSKPEGVGLGLALARHVSEAHHGTLGWTREGGWTRFRLSLPVNGVEPEKE